MVNGKSVELDILKDVFGVSNCKTSQLRCTECKFNNFGMNRIELGENCGIVIIANTVRQVMQNYCALDLDSKTKTNRESASNSSDMGIIF
jgi:hypothetical protein